MTGNNPNLGHVNINANIKFGQILSIRSQTVYLKAPVTHSRFWLRLITICPDETYIVKSGCIGMVKTENSEIPTMSHDVPTVSLRLLYDS